MNNGSGFWHSYRAAKTNNANTNFFGHLIGYTIVSFFRGIWHWRLTLAWAVFLIVCLSSDSIFVNILGVLLFLGIHVGGYWCRPLWKAAAFRSDLQRRSLRKQRLAQIAYARDYLVQTGIFNEDEAMSSRSWMEYDEEKECYHFHWRDRQRKWTEQAAIQKLVEYKSDLGAIRAHSKNAIGGGVDIIFYKKDPLDMPHNRDRAGNLDPESMTVECAVDGFGAPVSLRFGDSSGMVVGGLPGSGKTAGVSSFLLPLALSPYVNLSIVDGKGGEDWSSYAGAADPYIRGDEELDPIVSFLANKHAEMLDRLSNQKQKLGTSNFWNASAEDRLKAGLKFELLVIDECQGVFETTGRSKEERETLGYIFKYLSAMVKRGRSAGFFVIFMTQKPTNDSLPTAIRDNAGLRVAFRVKTAIAESVILGDLGDEAGVVSAMQIPQSRRGGAVLQKDTGELDAVRFFYISEDIQASLLQGVGHSPSTETRQLDPRNIAEPDEDDGGFEFSRV